MSKALAKVCEFALARSVADFPMTTLQAAATFMLDTAGIAAAAAPMDAGRIARDMAFSLYGTTDLSSQARMMFDGRTVSLAGAAFAAASQIDNLDGHDGYAPSKGHIGVVILPTLAAMMQQVPDMSGPEALAAVTVGYEVAGRAAQSLHASVSDYHTSGAWNGLGVAAMAGRMRGIEADTLRQALGIAEYHGPRSQMMREIANPTMLHDGGGMGALVGISAIVAAEKGFTGAPAITVEDTEVASFWDDLGGFWQMEHQYIKPYPTCRWAHGALDAVKGLISSNQISTADIAKIDIGTFHEAACLFQGMPETTSQAQYSLRFAIASLIVHGEIGLDQISGSGLCDREVAQMLQKISITEDARHSVRFPAGRWAHAKITLNNGKELNSGDVNASGGPENSWTLDQVKQKYSAFAVPVLGKARADELQSGILGLMSPNSRLSELDGLLHHPI